MGQRDEAEHAPGPKAPIRTEAITGLAMAPMA
jgi:hypothetical protein